MILPRLICLLLVIGANFVLATTSPEDTTEGGGSGKRKREGAPGSPPAGGMEEGPAKKKQELPPPLKPLRGPFTLPLEIGELRTAELSVLQNLFGRIDLKETAHFDALLSLPAAGSDGGSFLADNCGLLNKRQVVDIIEGGELYESGGGARRIEALDKSDCLKHLDQWGNLTMEHLKAFNSIDLTRLKGIDSFQPELLATLLFKKYTHLGSIPITLCTEASLRAILDFPLLKEGNNWHFLDFNMFNAALNDEKLTEHMVERLFEIRDGLNSDQDVTLWVLRMETLFHAFLLSKSKVKEVEKQVAVLLERRKEKVVMFDHGPVKEMAESLSPINKFIQRDLEQVGEEDLEGLASPIRVEDFEAVIPASVKGQQRLTWKQEFIKLYPQEKPTFAIIEKLRISTYMTQLRNYLQAYKSQAPFDLSLLVFHPLSNPDPEYRSFRLELAKMVNEELRKYPADVRKALMEASRKEISSLLYQIHIALIDSPRELSEYALFNLRGPSTKLDLSHLGPDETLESAIWTRSFTYLTNDAESFQSLGFSVGMDAGTDADAIRRTWIQLFQDALFSKSSDLLSPLRTAGDTLTFGWLVDRSFGKILGRLVGKAVQLNLTLTKKIDHRIIYLALTLNPHDDVNKYDAAITKYYNDVYLPIFEKHKKDLGYTDERAFRNMEESFTHVPMPKEITFTNHQQKSNALPIPTGEGPEDTWEMVPEYIERLDRVARNQFRELINQFREGVGEFLNISILNGILEPTLIPAMFEPEAVKMDDILKNVVFDQTCSTKIQTLIPNVQAPMKDVIWQVFHNLEPKHVTRLLTYWMGTWTLSKTFFETRKIEIHCSASRGFRTRPDFLRGPEYTGEKDEPGPFTTYLPNDHKQLLKKVAEEQRRTYANNLPPETRDPYEIDLYHNPPEVFPITSQACFNKLHVPPGTGMTPLSAPSSTPPGTGEQPAPAAQEGFETTTTTAAFIAALGVILNEDPTGYRG